MPHRVMAHTQVLSNFKNCISYFMITLRLHSSHQNWPILGKNFKKDMFCEQIHTYDQCAKLKILRLEFIEKNLLLYNLYWMNLCQKSSNPYFKLLQMTGQGQGQLPVRVARPRGQGKCVGPWTVYVTEWEHGPQRLLTGKPLVFLWIPFTFRICTVL